MPFKAVLKSKPGVKGGCAAGMDMMVVTAERICGSDSTHVLKKVE
jgi:beta-phosphoglucomutase-like phosphatase (HAD superfamily)